MPDAWIKELAETQDQSDGMILPFSCHSQEVKRLDASTRVSAVKERD